MPTPSRVSEAPADEVRTADPGTGAAAVPGDHRWAVLGIVLAVLLMVVLDAEVTAVLGPALVKDLGFGITSVNISVALVWMFTAVLLILAGDAADRFGRRRLFLWASCLYLLSGLLSGLGPDAVTFFAGRALLGAAMAAIATAGVALLNAVFTGGRDRSIAFGCYAAVLGGATGIAPLFGGLVVRYGSWRLAFLIPVGVTALCLPLGFKYLPGTRRSEGGHGLAVSGTILFAVGLGALLMLLQLGGDYGWWKPTRQLAFAGVDWPSGAVSITPVLMAVAVVSLVAFALEERARYRKGLSVLIRIDLWKRPVFRLSNIVAFFFIFGPFAMTLVVPIFTGIALKLDPLQTGLMLLPFGLAVAIFGLVATPLAQRHDNVWVVNAGMVVIVAGLLLGALAMDPAVVRWALPVPLFITGAGFGMSFAKITDVAMDAVPEELGGVASGTLLTVRVGAICLGGAVLSALLLGTAVPRATSEIDALAELHPSDRQEIVGLLHSTANAPAGSTSSGRDDGTTIDDVASDPALEHGAVDIEGAYVWSTRLVFAVSALLVLIGLVFGHRLARAARSVPIEQRS